MIEINKNYNESNLETMAKMPNCFVDLTVTSPPYDGLRTYNGYSFPFENIANELYRVTKQGGVLVWVIGDETKNFCESMTSFKQAIYLKELGFNLLDTMIYYKQNYAPAYPTLRRYANQFEYMFVFSKGKPKTFSPIQKDKVRNKEEKVAYRQKDGTLKRKVKEKGRDTKDASNVWEFAVGGNLTGHPAVFPLQLAIDHILTWTNENDLVYDCFNGSGTTSEACIKTNRNWIGSEISNEYCNIIEERIKKAWEEKRKEKAAEEYANKRFSSKDLEMYQLSGKQVNRIIKTTFASGVEFSDNHWQEKSVEMFNKQRRCVHEWEPIWDNNSSLTSVKHRCLKCGEIQ